VNIPPRRLALAISADGDRWVTTIADTGDVPKTMVRAGRAYTTIMTASVEHTTFAAMWAQDVNRPVRDRSRQQTTGTDRKGQERTPSLGIR
jgi:hypothetical protein